MNTGNLSNYMAQMQNGEVEMRALEEKMREAGFTQVGDQWLAPGGHWKCCDCKETFTNAPTAQKTEMVPTSNYREFPSGYMRVVVGDQCRKCAK